jgi:asparagine synthase (glutamine-hydrolysing)
MSGICGVFNLSDSARPVERGTLDVMAGALRHRGPDERNVFVAADGSLGLAHCALLTTEFAGREPGKSQSGGILVLTDGPVYNAAELEKSVSGSAAGLGAGKQAALIARLYERDGEKAFAQIDGDCAYAVIDTRKGQVHLVRDGLGSRSLYYALAGGACVFASEAKAVLAHPSISPRVNEEALYYLFAFGSVRAPDTAYKDIRTVCCGEYVTISRGGGVASRMWWHPLQRPVEEGKPEAYYLERVRQLLRDATAKRCRSTREVSVFMGGLDSCALAGLMGEAIPGRGHTITLDMPLLDPNAPRVVEYADRDCANLLGEKLPIKVHIKEPVVEELWSLLLEMGRVFDEPVMLRNLATMGTTKYARDLGMTCCLIGEPPDALFVAGIKVIMVEALTGKMGKLKWMPHFLRSVISRLALRTRHLNRPPVLLDRGRDMWRQFAQGREIYWGNCLYFLGEELDSLFAPDFRARTKGVDPYNTIRPSYQVSRRVRPHAHPFDYMASLDSQKYAEETTYVWERCCSANSLELRMPYFDKALVEFCFSIPFEIKRPGQETKYLLKKSMEGILPREVIHREKVASGQALYGWLKPHFPGIVRKLFETASPEAKQYFDMNKIRRVIELHESGAVDLSLHMTIFISYLLWHRRWMEGREITRREIEPS